jgi:hypothetical protein
LTVATATSTVTLTASYTPPLVSSLAPWNIPHPFGISMTLYGANFASFDSSPRARGHFTSCKASVWVSDSSVVCKFHKLSAATTSMSAIVTVGRTVTTQTRAFSYEVACALDGLAATYFDNSAMTVPRVFLRDATVDFSGGVGDLNNPGVTLSNLEFTTRWGGYVIPTGGVGVYTFTFSVNGDDERLRVWLFGTQMVDLWTSYVPAMTSVTWTAFLWPGDYYDLKIEYNSAFANDYLFDLQITTLKSTGLTAGSALAASGATDAFWTLTSSADGTNVGPAALVLSPLNCQNGLKPPSAATSATAQFIEPGPTGSTAAVGSYTFTTSFDLTTVNPFDAYVEFQFAADDAVTAIRINSANAVTTPTFVNPSGAFHTISTQYGASSTSNAFVQRTNTLEFVISNTAHSTLFADAYSIGVSTASTTQVPFSTPTLCVVMNFFWTVGSNAVYPALANYYPIGAGNDVALRFQGSLNVASTTAATFYLTSDDGARLYLDGSQIIDNDGLHGMNTKYAHVASLTAGAHTFKTEYFERSGNAGFKTEVRYGAGGTRRALANSDFTIRNRAALLVNVMSTSKSRIYSSTFFLSRLSWSGPSVATVVVAASALAYNPLALGLAPHASCEIVAITSAHWGPAANGGAAGAGDVVVTAAVKRRLLDGQQLTMAVNSQNVGIDPTSAAKRLLVAWTKNAVAQTTQNVADGGTLTLS